MEKDASLFALASIAMRNEIQERRRLSPLEPKQFLSVIWMPVFLLVFSVFFLFIF